MMEYNRPTSVMSMLADQMQLSCLNDQEEMGLPVNQINCRFSPIENNNTSDDDFEKHMSTSAPPQRLSLRGAHPFSGEPSLLVEEPPTVATDDHWTGGHQLPSKRKCHSVSGHLPRPIALKPIQHQQQQHHHQHHQHSQHQPQHHHCHHHFSLPRATIVRPIISPHYKKSAFTPTSGNRSRCSSTTEAAMPVARPSPPNSSSDYSISPPDLDNASPSHTQNMNQHQQQQQLSHRLPQQPSSIRPASDSSSGFHDLSSQQSSSLLLLADCALSSDMTIASSADSDNSPDYHCSQSQQPCFQECCEVTITPLQQRCHSQPSDESAVRGHCNRRQQSRRIIGTPVVETTMSAAAGTHHRPDPLPIRASTQTRCKRRYPSDTQIPEFGTDCRIQAAAGGANCCVCCKPRRGPCSSSADNSPSALTGGCHSGQRRDCFFFNNNRNYQVSLPRIASSPPPQSFASVATSYAFSSGGSSGRRQRIGSNSSSHSTSTTVDANTPTVVPSAVAPQTPSCARSQTDGDLMDTDQPESPLVAVPVLQLSMTTGTAALRDPGDPPEIMTLMGPPSFVSSDSGSSTTDDYDNHYQHQPSFQPLDIDQIELD